jgi:GntR family transcriptional regulator
MVHAALRVCQCGGTSRLALDDQETAVTSDAALPARAPKYYTVKLHLLEYIESLEQGAPVPTERDLAADLETSRTTVRQALVELVAEGRLVRRQGSGTYVADAKITWPLQLASFTEQAAANGQVPSSQLLGVSRIRATTELADRLGTRVGVGLHQIDRLRLADDRPTAVETAFLSASRFPYLGRKMRSAASLEALLSNDFGVKLRGGEATIDTMPASPWEAGLLKVDTGSPMLVVRRRSFDTDGTPVEWATSWFRGDRITLVAQLLVPGR